MREEREAVSNTTPDRFITNTFLHVTPTTHMLCNTGCDADTHQVLLLTHFLLNNQLSHVICPDVCRVTHSEQTAINQTFVETDIIPSSLLKLQWRYLSGLMLTVLSLHHR